MRRFSPNNETSLTETDRQGSALRIWSVAFVRRTQGRCIVAKEVTKELSRSVVEASKENGAGDEGSGVY